MGSGGWVQTRGISKPRTSTQQTKINKSKDLKMKDSGGFMSEIKGQLLTVDGRKTVDCSCEVSVERKEPLNPPLPSFMHGFLAQVLKLRTAVSPNL